MTALDVMEWVNKVAEENARLRGALFAIACDMPRDRVSELPPTAKSAVLEVLYGGAGDGERPL